MLEQFGTGIWLASGPEVTAAGGFHYPTRMAVIRLTDGALFVCSPIPLNDGLRSSIDALGPVRHIIAPNSLHHLSVPEWQQAYPEAKAYAAPRLQAKRKDIQFDGELGGGPAPDWAGQIEQVPVNGNAITTEVVFFHHASGTALFTDLLQQMPTDWFSGWRAIVAKLDLMVAPEPKVPRKFRLAFTNRHTARAALEKIYAWPTTKVVMAHGTPVTENGRIFIQQSFCWL